MHDDDREPELECRSPSAVSEYVPITAEEQARVLARAVESYGDPQHSLRRADAEAPR